MRELIIYTTLGCHLCERAEAMVAEQGVWPHLQLSRVDIADDDALLEQYGTRIPVLYRPDCRLELDWPFNLDILEQFLSWTDPESCGGADQL